MATSGMFRRVSERTIEQLRANPERVRAVLYPNTTETAIDDDVRIDVDIAWHALHYLLTGEVGTGKAPLDFILGGTAVGDDLGSGPARMFGAAEVRRIAAALALINAVTLRTRFDAMRLQAAGIYPQRWDHPGTQSSVDFVLEQFAALKDFVATTAEAEAGMIVYLM